jgi:hypothetical protein
MLANSPAHLLVLQYECLTITSQSKASIMWILPIKAPPTGLPFHCERMTRSTTLESTFNYILENPLCLAKVNPSKTLHNFATYVLHTPRYLAKPPIHSPWLSRITSTQPDVVPAFAAPFVLSLTQPNLQRWEPTNHYFITNNILLRYNYNIKQFGLLI